MTGYQSLHRGTQNGGTLLSTMSPPWLELESSVFPMLWHHLDGTNVLRFYFNLLCKTFNHIFRHFFIFILGKISQSKFRGPGVVILILSWIITLYTLWQMVEMHEMVPGKRFDRYHELGQHAFGEKLGLYIVVPQQLICEVGVNIVYMVTGGKSLKKFHKTVCDDCKEIKTTYFIMIFASVHFVLSHLPNFNSISGVSLAAAVMSLT